MKFRTTTRVFSALALTAAIAVAASAAATAGTTPGGWLKPGAPLSGQQHPDPSITTLGSTLFSVSTKHGGSNLPSVWSADGTMWTARTQLDGQKWLNDALPSMPWGASGKSLWAPTVKFVGDHWVAYVAVRTANPPAYTSYGRFAIYAATASSPNGPFTAVSRKPAVNVSVANSPGGVLDPNIFVDPVTNLPYLLWKTEGNTHGNYPTIWARRLNSEGTAFAAGSHTRKLISVSQKWEGKVVENPSMTRVNGRYVLLYSGNVYSSTKYATGYAICSSPLGDCRKSARNPILKSASGSYAPGGADGVVDSRGRFLVAYAAYSRQSGGHGSESVGRTMRIAQFSASKSGVSVLRRTIGSNTSTGYLWSSNGTSFSSQAQSVGGNYLPFSGDFNADGRADLGLYGSWTRPDAIAYSDGNQTFHQSSSALNQAGAFEPVAGDFNGDGRTDVYWYEPGNDPVIAFSNRAGANYDSSARVDTLSFKGTGTSWSSESLAQDWTAEPIVGDFDHNGLDDILWYRPGSASDSLWLMRSDGNGGTTVVRKSLQIGGNYTPVAGDFNGNGYTDIYWYAPGAAKDVIWWFGEGGEHVASTSTAAMQVTRADYRPFAGDFNGDGKAEIFWYAPGAASDCEWSSISPDGTHVSHPESVSGNFTPVVGDYDGNGTDDIWWLG